MRKVFACAWPLNQVMQNACTMCMSRIDFAISNDICCSFILFVVIFYLVITCIDDWIWLKLSIIRSDVFVHAFRFIVHKIISLNRWTKHNGVYTPNDAVTTKQMDLCDGSAHLPCLWNTQCTHQNPAEIFERSSARLAASLNHSGCGKSAFARQQGNATTAHM